MKFFALLALFFVSAAVHASVDAADVAAYRALALQDQRLAEVGHRLAKANAPFCKRRVRNPGWVLHDEKQYPDRDVARAAFGFPLPIAVSVVVPGGEADRLGIKPGDGLAAIGDSALEASDDGPHKQSAKRIEQIENDLRSALRRDGPVRITLKTDKGLKQMELDPPAICASHFWVDAKSSLDAGADGEGVRVTEGFMAFNADDDAELAAVVAHELAHNILGHRDILNNRSPRIKEILATEIEADRLSVWLMANAGFDPRAALRFTERHGRKTGLGILSSPTHQRWRTRMKTMQAEIDLMDRTDKKDGLLPPPLLLSGDDSAPR